MRSETWGCPADPRTGPTLPAALQAIASLRFGLELENLPLGAPDVSAVSPVTVRPPGPNEDYVTVTADQSFDDLCAEWELDPLSVMARNGLGAHDAVADGTRIVLPRVKDGRLDLDDAEQDRLETYYQETSFDREVPRSLRAYIEIEPKP